jgi:coenzyme F420-0:L-glutamate ligase/coenzyme F420-1:gamma-L-glutamate ligase
VSRRALTVFPVAGLPEVRPGDDLVGLVTSALARVGERLAEGDVVVVAQKIVSKSEGRVVRLADVAPSERAKEMAGGTNKDPRQLEVVLRETKTILRWERGVLISETHHGFVCANAGVDRSNAGQPDAVVLLPVDPDGSAARLREEVTRRAGVHVAVVITDTFGRAWREGHMNVAIGIAGLPALKRYMGQLDPEGYELRVTEIAVADEVAAAAELVMGKLDRCPVAIVRGLAFDEPAETAREYVRPAEKDLFR